MLSAIINNIMVPAHGSLKTFYSSRWSVVGASCSAALVGTFFGLACLLLAA